VPAGTAVQHCGADRGPRDSFSTEFSASRSAHQKILWGVRKPMGKQLDSWACPLCNSEMILDVWKNPSGTKPGFKLTCKGTDEVPHRLRIFLEGFRKDASFLPGPKVSPAEAPRTSRAKELLARAERLAA
jgi:hypothetical protein